MSTPTVTTMEELESRIKYLEGKVSFLLQALYLEAGGSIGLQHYTFAWISELTGTDHAKQMKQYVAHSQRSYDSLISSLEDVDPAGAAAVDVRGMMAQPGRDQWYFPTKPE